MYLQVYTRHLLLAKTSFAVRIRVYTITILLTTLWCTKTSALFLRNLCCYRLQRRTSRGQRTQNQVCMCIASIFLLFGWLLVWLLAVLFLLLFREYGEDVQTFDQPECTKFNVTRFDTLSGQLTFDQLLGRMISCIRSKCWPGEEGEPCAKPHSEASSKCLTMSVLLFIYRNFLSKSTYIRFHCLQSQVLSVHFVFFFFSNVS